jgi:DNA modification methylase
VYADHPEIPTNPRLVTPSTRLDTLNLNWREKDLPERERTKHVHRLHPYVGKFIPQLVEIFLRKYFQPGDTVYDPFCGSGTTLVEANPRHIHAVGCDISAFNCLLTQVKTAHYDIKLMRQEVLDILHRVTKRCRGWDLEPQRHDGDDTDDEYLLAWFAPRSRQELLTYRSLIPDYEYQALLQVILSRAARSARLTTHFDLESPKQPQMEPYYCRKHKRTCRPVQEALKFLRRYSQDTIRRIERYNRLQTAARTTVLWGDARSVELPGKVDGVITSPPYVGLIDYHEQHRYAYAFLDLPINSAGEIGAASKGNSRQAKDIYQREIASVFQHTATYLDPGQRAILVVRDRDDLFPEIAEQCGFELEDSIRRHVNRRTGLRAAELFENVLIWKKR